MFKISISRRYKKYLPYYTQNELIFPGIKFESVNIDNKLTTYFDTCDTFINNALSVESFKEGLKLRVKARRYCLNYKPFTYRFNVNSDKETKAVLKIFLGPAFGNVRNEKDMSYLREYYKYFFEMDKFVVTRKLLCYMLSFQKFSNSFSRVLRQPPPPLHTHRRASRDFLSFSETRCQHDRTP